jgi:hypothetical protein
MAIKILPSLIQEFILSASDLKYNNEGTPTMVKVRQATRGDEETRNHLFAMVEKQYKPEGVISFTSVISIDDVDREEVFLTLADCNIIKAGDGNEPLFKFKNSRFDMSKSDFQASWSSLPFDIAKEISDCVKKVNLQWSPSGNE